MVNEYPVSAENIRLIWSDDSLLVIDKPPGLLSLPDGYWQQEPHLLEILKPAHGRLWIVHRLDRDTSGIMLLARSAQAHHLLNDQFASRKVKKTYHALVWGCPAWSEMNIDQPLRKNGDRSHRTVIDPERGKPALTNCRVLSRFVRAALIQAQPHTGYTHQIRAHLAWAGFPIIADQLYWTAAGEKTTPKNEEVTLPIARTALHALSIRFTHPFSGEEMIFEAPYPADFRAAVLFFAKLPGD